MKFLPPIYTPNPRYSFWDRVGPDLLPRRWWISDDLEMTSRDGPLWLTCCENGFRAPSAAMVPLPLVKLVGLAVKQFISKPVASLCKSQVKTRPFLRNRICIPIGRGYHHFQVRQKFKGLNTVSSWVLRNEWMVFFISFFFKYRDRKGLREWARWKDTQPRFRFVKSMTTRRWKSARSWSERLPSISSPCWCWSLKASSKWWA